MFDSLLRPYEREVAAFGEHWCGPAQYVTHTDHLVAKYKADGDGQNVEVWCCPMPARFYTLKVDGRADSIGRPQFACDIGTGSGQWEMAAMIAKAVAEGMLAVDPPKSPQKTSGEPS